MAAVYEDIFGYYDPDADPDEPAFFAFIKSQSKPRQCLRCCEPVLLQPGRECHAADTTLMRIGALHRPSLALSPLVAALEVRIETIVGGAFDLGRNGSVVTNSLFAKGSVITPDLSGFGVANDNEAEPHLRPAHRQVVAYIYAIRHKEGYGRTVPSGR